MVAVVNDPQLEQQLIEERRRTGADKYDEVWEGVYMVAPLASNAHQRVVGKLYAVLETVIGQAGQGEVFPGVNVSDRVQDWATNFRCPDVAVFLKGTGAQNHDAFWFGGPDLVVEVVSPHDRSREKLTFYATVRTRELLLVEHGPYQLQLYRLVGDELVEVGRSSVDSPNILSSHAVPLTLQVDSSSQPPSIILARTDETEHWTI